MHGTPLPAPLLWDAGELTLLRDAPDAARGYFRVLQVTLEPGRMADAAAAYQQQIDLGNAPWLRAELLYTQGDPAAWDGIAKALKQRGFKFVGSTMVYAYMQSVGLVNDHVTGCFRAPD